MAIEKLFNVLVIGGVAMGVQACKKKELKSADESANTINAEKAVTVPAELQKVVPSAAEKVETETLENSITLDRFPSGLEVNSKGEKCEDICSGEGVSTMCADMCCWLQATECCPNYSPPVQPEAEESKGTK